MAVDAQGRVKTQAKFDDIFDIKNVPARPGHNIRLTIDRDLQKSAFQALKDKVGSAVAVEVTTGEILVMVSRPSFDPTKFSRGLSQKYWNSLINDNRHPLRDRTIQEHYAPGSAYKIITALAALEEGIIDENTEIICKGNFKLGRRKFHCWRRGGHGKVKITKAIRESCDVFFYKIGTKIDIDVLARYAHLFGLGVKTGIGLPRETTGLIPTKDWKYKRNGKEWQLGETLSCVIGQSYVLTTPLQLAMTFATVANGGTLFKPYLIKEVFSNSGDIIRKSSPEKVADIQISQKSMEIIKNGLFQVVNSRSGTAWYHRGRGIRMAGKTGTSQVIKFSADKIYSRCEEREYKFRHHGIFTAYAPADNPKIAIAVVVEHGCHGSSAAAPVALAVVTTFMDKYYPELRKKFLLEEKKQLQKKLKLEKKKKNEPAVTTSSV